jgi:hypothetical protein
VSIASTISHVACVHSGSCNVIKANQPNLDGINVERKSLLLMFNDALFTDPTSPKYQTANNVSTVLDPPCQNEKIRNLTRSQVQVNVYSNKINVGVHQSASDACMIVPPERENIGDACTLA